MKCVKITLFFIVSAFVESYNGYYDGDNIEDLAGYTADRAVVYIIDNPNRRDDGKLRQSNLFAVSGPHGECSAALCDEEKDGYPPFFSEK